MNPAEILDTIEKSGCTVVLDGENLVLKGPRGSLSDEAISELTRVKPALVQLLKVGRETKVETQAVEFWDGDRWVGVKLYSPILGDFYWLVFDSDYYPNDGVVAYWPDELPVLKNMTTEEKKIAHRLKKHFGWKITEYPKDDKSLVSFTLDELRSLQNRTFDEILQIGRVKKIFDGKILSRSKVK